MDSTRREEKRFSHSAEETVRIGEEFGAQYLRSGTVVCVRGELGAGKTHFIKGIAGSLGIDERELTSPTFALAHEFDCLMRGQPFRLYHLDCYRFEKPEELLELGVEDYLYPKNAATIIEWPERIASLIPNDAIEVEIRVISEYEREIKISPKNQAEAHP
jgi:tRNA threonylcarbamoyladenosine biosynthesis protein TsaE